ncbi:MAG: DUF2231 domain-containing protein [Euzebyales bacterium]|nr:DUF2231 domain-containing protein [Euzebyales bacterium]
MNPLMRAAQRLETLDLLDPAIDPVRRVVQPLMGGGNAGDVLGGGWFGHPVHPLLIVVPIGFLSAAATLDAVGGRDGERPAEWLLGVGLLGMAPTVATGLSDWSRADRPAQRVGAVHALANVLGGLLAWRSYQTRRRGDAPRARRLLRLGLAAIGVGGYLGGHLTYALGVRVERG